MGLSALPPVVAPPVVAAELSCGFQHFPSFVISVEYYRSSTNNIALDHAIEIFVPLTEQCTCLLEGINILSLVFACYAKYKLKIANLIVYLVCRQGVSQKYNLLM